MADESGTTPEGGYTPPPGSLEEGAKAFERLLTAAESPETKEKPEAQPEQPTRTAESAQQAPPAPEGSDKESGSEEATSAPAEEAQPSDEPSEIPTVTVKVDGKEIEIPLDEALKGYSRTQDYTRKTQALAEERKQFESTREAELQAVRAERDQYAAVLPELKKVLASLTTEPDWSQRALEVPPIQLAEEMRNWKAAQARIQQVDAEAARLRQQQEKEQAEVFQRTAAQEYKALTEALPDLADPEKAKSVWSDWKSYATDAGFSEQELAGVTNHRLLLLLDKAMKWDAAQKKAPEIKNKVERAIKPAAPGNNTPPSKPTKYQDATKRLRQTGRIEDAAAALESIL